MQLPRHRPARRNAPLSLRPGLFQVAPSTDFFVDFFSVELADAKLRSIYGRAEWDTGRRRLRNPYLHYQSPPKHHTAVQLAQGHHVRSQKQQTTPRVGGVEQTRQAVKISTSRVSAVQVAPPVRAGPSDRHQSALSSSSSSITASEMLSSTPIHSDTNIRNSNFDTDAKRTYFPTIGSSKSQTHSYCVDLLKNH